MRFGYDVNHVSFRNLGLPGSFQGYDGVSYLYYRFWALTIISTIGCNVDMSATLSKFYW